MIGERPTGRLGVAYARGRKLLAVLVRHRYRAALLRGVAAATEHEPVPFDAETATVIDVGANRGQFTLLALERFPLARILAFEPHPSAFARLTQVTRDDPRVRCTQRALGAVSGKGTLHLSREDDSSSLLDVGATYLATWPGTYMIGQVEVDVVRLDDVVSVDELHRPTLLKIDVQGTELQVLEGAERILHRIDAVFVECSFVELYDRQALAGDVIAFLRDRGFSLVGLYSAAYDRAGVCLQADLLFRRW